MKILNFDDLKAILKIDKTEENYPDLIILESSVIAAIENYLGRYIKQGDFVETVTVPPSGDIPLKALPVIGIDNITISEAILLPYEYKIKFFGVTIGFVSEDSTAEISYTGGFEKVPDSLYRAILMQTIYEYQNSANIGATSVSTEGGTIQRPELGLLAEVKRLINLYIHPMKGIY